MTPLMRTRRLYAWESYDLHHRKGVCDIGLELANIIVRLAWLHFKMQQPQPRIIMKRTKEQPYCIGWSEIALTSANHTDLVLLHELAHAMRYGTEGNPHTAGFVRQYIELMAWYYQWNKEELLCQTHQLKLLS